MKSSTETAARSLTLLCALGFIALGLHMLSLPAITLFRVWPYHLLPSGEIIVGMGILLALFHGQAAHGLIWVGTKIHRWLTALILFAALGADGLMHVFNIPHIEGWWVALLGTGATASFCGVWFVKHKKCHHTQDTIDKPAHL